MGERQHCMLIWCCMVAPSDQALMEMCTMLDGTSCGAVMLAAQLPGGGCGVSSDPRPSSAAPIASDTSRALLALLAEWRRAVACAAAAVRACALSGRRGDGDGSAGADGRVLLPRPLLSAGRGSRAVSGKISKVCLGWCLEIEAHLTRIVRCTAACSTSLRLGVMRAGCRKLSVRRVLTDQGAPALPLRCGCSRRCLVIEEALSLGMKPPGEAKDDSGASSANGLPLHWPDRPKLKPPVFGGMTAVCPSEGAMRVHSARSVSSWATVRVLGPYAAGRRTTTYQHLSSQLLLTRGSYKQLLASNSSDLGQSGFRLVSEI